jgi:hypothetical protein
MMARRDTLSGFISAAGRQWVRLNHYTGCEPELRRMAFRVAASIAAFARGFSDDPLIALQERGIQKAFAEGAMFVAVE